jgi:hypothetical protein
MAQNLAVGVATGTRERITPDRFAGLCGRFHVLSLVSSVVQPGPAPQSVLGFFFEPTVLLTSARANVRGREELNRVRLLTSQRSKSSSGTCGNRQIGNDARSSRYERLEDEASLKGAAVHNRMAECGEVSLHGLSYDLGGSDGP